MYPKEVLTKSKAGKEEARVLIDQGKFTRYKYIDTKTGKADKKVSLILDSGKKEHFFLLPLKQGRRLMIEQKNMKSESKHIYDEKGKKVFKL